MNNPIGEIRESEVREISAGLRLDGRTPLELRPIKFTPNYLKYPSGSCLVEWGDNIIIAAASIQDTVPQFCKPLEQGWITAEYRLLPASTSTRNASITSARSMEIKRLIGRSLRSVVDLRAINNFTIIIDCEVIQADGGTRVACITGGFIALVWALKSLYEEGLIKWKPLKSTVTALSAVVNQGKLLIDPNFIEDSQGELDINLAFDGEDNIVELQVTAEKTTIPLDTLNKHVMKMIEVGRKVRELQLKSLPSNWEELKKIV